MIQLARITVTYGLDDEGEPEMELDVDADQIDENQVLGLLERAKLEVFKDGLLPRLCPVSAPSLRSFRSRMAREAYGADGDCAPVTSMFQWAIAMYSRMQRWGGRASL